LTTCPFSGEGAPESAHQREFKLRNSRFLLATACIFTQLCCARAPAKAETVTDFYRGKTLEISVGTGPGGGYDANARLVARHIGRFIPGAPKIIVANVPGGGGITAANKLFNVSPRDGLSIGTFSNALLTLPLLNPGATRFDPTKFTWIGSLSQEDGVCITSKSSGVATWNDLLAREVIVGTTAPGTTTHLYAALLLNLFSAKFRIVSGYPDGSSVVLAFTRGEVQALCQTYSSLNVLHPEWLEQRLVNPVATIGLNRIQSLPDIPSLMEFTRSERERDVVRILLAPTAAGRPFTAPPGIPADRGEALRTAFRLMSKDPDFLSDAGQARIEVQTMEGAAISALLDNISKTDPGIIDQARSAIEAGPVK
jgi:tripartite-type tricarboxylate transporter receptor subunit TctC